MTRNPTSPNKSDAGNGSYGICRVIDASRSPLPDPKRSAKIMRQLADCRNWKLVWIAFPIVCLPLACSSPNVTKRGAQPEPQCVQQGGEIKSTAIHSNTSKKNKSRVFDDQQQIEQFWLEFQLALKSRDSSKVAALTSFPLVDFHYEDIGQKGTREEFERAFPIIFNDDAIQFLLSQPASKLKKWPDGRWYAEWHNGVTSEGQLTIIYFFAARNGMCRLVQIVLIG